MSFSEYALKSQELRAAFLASHRGLAFVFEIGRFATIMALVLAVADLASFATFASTPGRRLVFIGAWAVLMAAVEAVRLHASAPKPPVRPAAG